MKIGLVGFPGSGKTTVFNALTGLSLCYAPNAGGDNVIWEAISGNTFAAWKAAHGNFDQHSFLTDPLFVDVGKRDFTPAASSPLVGHADPDQYSPIDLSGTMFEHSIILDEIQHVPEILAYLRPPATGAGV